MSAFSPPPKAVKVLGRDGSINKTERYPIPRYLPYLVCTLVLVYHYTFQEIPKLHKRGEMCG